MNWFGMNMIGELVCKMGDDFLECKNFGVISFNEVCEKFMKLGFKFCGDWVCWMIWGGRVCYVVGYWLVWLFMNLVDFIVFFYCFFN